MHQNPFCLHLAASAPMNNTCFPVFLRFTFLLTLCEYIENFYSACVLQAWDASAMTCRCMFTPLLLPNNIYSLHTHHVSMCSLRSSAARDLMLCALHLWKDRTLNLQAGWSKGAGRLEGAHMPACIMLDAMSTKVHAKAWCLRPAK